MDNTLSLECLSGAALRPHLDEVAALRISVFRDWPYLYDGDVAYEREYLDAYARSANSMVVLARGRLIAEGQAEAIRNDPKVQAVYFGTGKTFEKRGAARAVQEQAA